ncbi:tetratricopeptide repeat protein [Limnovirga soli]|uniref:Tetratricopeptide repeat protein n=1 Tax=Limnovirga soli TaxID=2656915 RepID=A0A8J8FAH4_9BACT|nr:tetratricopeptide repeat protein [Limnovirga soli]NNV54480.1 tetratricopeptide repeat protein [Limnovirga soli]
MNLYLKKISILSLLALSAFFSQAQYTKANDDPDADFKLAKELYQKEQFSLAYPLFKQLYVNNKYNSSIPITIQSEARYYSIVCGLTLKDATAEQDALEYVALEHNEPRVEMMSYHLGEYYYSKKNFTDAATYYEQTAFDNLSNSEIANMKFHQGYAYFTMQRLNEAKPLFDAIRQIPTDPNYTDANYYYGFIAFGEKRYTDALNAFKLTQDKPAYKGIVPYYITEIYYYSGEKDKALEYGEAALQKGGQFYDLQLRQIIGHIYFEKKNFAKALPFIEAFVTNTEKVNREDLYELSYCYYQAKQYTKAVAGFKELGGKQDSLAQNSMYLLADAYLELGQKPSARSAFLFCALNVSNSAQKEISRFNYGKLSYELGFTDIALTELKDFIAVYPKSVYNSEAKDLLVNVLANTNNYKEALDMVGKMPAKTETVKRVYPKILYGHAVELINDQQIAEADDLLNQIFTADYNAAQLPYTNFWKGEIAFRNNEFDSAIYYLGNYMRNPANYGEVNITNARYTLGYSALRQEDYVNALKYFEQISTSITTNAKPVELDAYTKSADCYFMQKKFSKALQMYDNIINNNLAQADYALYQKAIIAGAGSKYTEKISLLQSISARFPNSVMVPDANMEVANTYLANEQYEAAVTPLNAVLKNKNAVALQPQAFLKLGIAYFNQNNNTEALNNFKKLISGYPNSAESDDAVDYVRNIFVESQRTAEFVSFMRQNGKDVSYSEEDSLTYVGANIAYASKAYDNAITGLSGYLKQFPSGKYAVDANYQLAEIYNNRKDFAKAFGYYATVAEKAPNKYAESGVLQAARIAYFEQKDYNKAEQYFNQLKVLAVSAENKLEAMRGLLRCQFKLAQWTEGVANAKDLLQQKGIATDDKMMANMVIAKNSQNNSELFEAMAAYKTVIDLGKSEYGAEARYRIAEILLQQNRFPEAEKAGFDVINKAGSYDYWITKAYILLGDVYFKQADYFNAEATLKSVVDNASSPDLQKEAQQKLAMVQDEKLKNSKVSQ